MLALSDARLVRFIWGPKVRPFTISVAGLLAMLWNLSTPSLWQDEAATIGASNRSLPSLLHLVTKIDAVHATYYSFIHFWGGAFGFGAFSLRVPSIIAVAVSAYLLFHLAQQLGLGLNVATWASIIFLSLPRTEMSGSEARSNSVTATVIIGLTMVLIWTLKRDTSKVRWLAFAGLAAVATYLFMFNALILIAYAIFILIKHRKAFLPFVFASALALVASLPVLIYGYAEKNQVGWITAKPIYQYAWEAIIAVDYNRAWPMAILGISLAIFAVLRRAPLILILWAALPSTLLLLVSLTIHPYFVDHYLTFTTGGTALLIAYGLNQLKLPGKPLEAPQTRLLQIFVGVLIGALAVPSFIASREPLAKGTEWARIATTINQISKPGDGILLPDAVSPASRSLDLMIVAYAPEFAGRIDLTLKATPESTDRIFGKRWREVDAPEPASNRVLMVSDPADRSSMLEKAPSWLQSKFKYVRTIKFDTASIRVFERIS